MTAPDQAHSQVLEQAAQFAARIREFIAVPLRDNRSGAADAPQVLRSTRISPPAAGASRLHGTVDYYASTSRSDLTELCSGAAELDAACGTWPAAGVWILVGVLALLSTGGWLAVRAFRHALGLPR